MFVCLQCYACCTCVLQMAENFSRNLKPRRFSELPVWVVEDHNDVLPYIYRAIASRHLPFQGIAMLHFDSHPDLQIATEMDADTVFDKFELFSSLSIENWILPAVYAGHVHHVVWIKPPWSDQLPESSREVSIGKHCKSKKLRINWPDSYFLSDLLYAPEEDLEHTKKLQVDVVTMGTDLLPTDPKTSILGDPSHISDVTNKRTKYPVDFSRVTTDSQVPQVKGQCPLSKCSSCGQMSSVNDTPVKSQSEDTSLQIKEQKCKNCITEPTGGNSEEVSNKTKRKRSWVTHQASPSGYLSEIYNITNAALEKSAGTVLDIDLDFFSTRNPFKDIYSESQFHLLEHLYRFDGPVDNSQAALTECMLKRADQLSQLETALKSVVGYQEKVDSVCLERFQKVQSLVESLRVASNNDKALDAEMIHMAGLTCDDNGELPHHVSSEEEIDSLVATMQTLLSWLPRPVMVTVARSSHDDYCPPEQVDQIQHKVLQMLQNVYGKIDVHMDYKNYDENSEKT
ncbi:UPF0489 protein C5orf22 homolog [Acanthaster planci]|uniref:UPF0489 protein C5orf22 homolog n=1 Tax=Acanthaster planci TaxID=133434 RepID=A0A8B7XPU2_ACAPL|nr:UPF0489 protein C5orf22 homolog [Acanthaster planci]